MYGECLVVLLLSQKSALKGHGVHYIMALLCAK